MLTDTPRWSHARDNEVVPSPWQATRLLILGGSVFAGRALVHEAIGRGWTVTCVNRGSRAPIAGSDTITADRRDAGAIAAAVRRTDPDVIVDTWEGTPDAVASAARAAAASECVFGYLSSRSVYLEPIPAGAGENHPTVAMTPDVSDNSDYSLRKRGGELAALRELGSERTLILRCGLIVGPRENSGRLIWWLNRCVRGGQLIAPTPPDLPLQLIDVRDLAVFALDLLERRRGGVFDVVGPPGHTTVGELVALCRTVTGAVADVTWIDPSWLLARDVQPISDIPLWAPRDTREYSLHSSDPSLAITAGLRCRPFSETVRDTWLDIEVNGTPAVHYRRIGLAPERERQLIELWGAAL